jgi:hypothetical protein
LAWSRYDSSAVAGASSTLSGQEGAVLASATSVTLTDLYHRVSGTTTVTSFADGTGMDRGLFVIRPTGVFQIGTSGNISGAPPVTTVGRLLIFWYDGTTFYYLGGDSVAGGLVLTIPAGSSAAMIQAALDAVDASGAGIGSGIGGKVILAPGAYSGAATGIRVGSRTDFEGCGMGTKITAPTGATAHIIGLKTTSTERSRIANMWLEGNKVNATVSGVDLDNDGGTFTGASPEIRLENILVTNCALDSFRIKSRLSIRSARRSENRGATVST